MPTSLSSRLLAPLALVACVIAVGVVAMSSLGDDGSSQPASATRAETGTSTAKRTSTTARSTYTVKSGDSLSLIAEKTGVDVEVIVRLNPGVDPQSLRTGQKLKLRGS